MDWGILIGRLFRPAGPGTNSFSLSQPSSRPFTQCSGKVSQYCLLPGAIACDPLTHFFGDQPCSQLKFPLADPGFGKARRLDPFGSELQNCIIPHFEDGLLPLQRAYFWTCRQDMFVIFNRRLATGTFGHL